MENKVESTESVFKFSGYLNTDIEVFIQKLQSFFPEISDLYTHEDLLLHK